MPDCAGFLFGFKARQQAHSKLCNCWRNTEAGQKDQQDGIFFDRNRLNPAILSVAVTEVYFAIIVLLGRFRQQAQDRLFFVGSAVPAKLGYG